MAGDIEENVQIHVEGADSLAEAAAEARALDEELRKVRDDAVEASAAMDGLKASSSGAATQAGRLSKQQASLRDALLASAASMDAMKASASDAAAESARLGEERGKLLALEKEYQRIAKEAGASRSAPGGLGGSGDGGGAGRSSKRDRQAVQDMAQLEREIRSAGMKGTSAGIAGTGGLDKYASDIEKLKAEIASAEPQIDRMNSAISGSADKAAVASTAMGKWHESLGGFGSGSGDSGTALRASRDLEGVLGDFGRASDEALHGLSDLAPAMDEAGKSAGGLFSGLSSVGDVLGPAGAAAGGLAMPAAIGALVSAVATAGPVAIAAGAGFGAWGALAAPALKQVETGLTNVTAAQASYRKAQALEQVAPTAAHAKSEAAALQSLNAAYAQIPADVRPGVKAVQSLEQAWSEAGKKSGIQQAALKDIPKAANDIKGLIPSVTKLAGATTPVISGILGDLGKFEKSKGFSQFIGNITSQIPEASASLKKLGNAVGSVVTELFSKKNMQAGDNLITSTAGLVKSFGPGLTNQLTQGAKILAGVNHTLTDWAKPGAPLNNFGKHWDQTVGIGESALNNGRQHTNQLMSWNRTAGKGIADFFDPHFSSHGVSWNYSNLQTPVPTRNVSAQQMQGARALQQGGRAGGYGQVPAENVTARQQQGAKALEKLPPITEKVKIDTSGAKSELASLSHYKMQDAKVKVSVTGADTAKTAFQGVVTAGQQAGTKAGAAIGTGIQSGQGKATSAATAVAGGVKGAVAPLPGALQSTGAAAGAGMAAGISSETGAVTAAASALAAAAESAAKVHLQVQSPSKVFKKIGENTVLGYLLGLEGGKAAVQKAMRMVLGTPAPNSTIKATVTAITKEIDLAAKAGKINPLQKMGLTQLLDLDNTRLQKLAAQRQKLENQIQAADALAKSVQQAAVQSADLNTIAAATPAGQAAAASDGSLDFALGGTQAAQSSTQSIQQGLQTQLKSIQQFRQQIIKLKKDGLDKQGIQELLAAGVQQGGATATQMLAGGKKAVQQIAQLDNSIGLASKKLGITGGNAAYEGASQIGGALAAGLKSSLKAVDTEMASITKSLVTGIMTALGDSSKQIKAALKKLDKELGIDSGAGSGGSGKKSTITPPHIIYSPKPEKGPGGFAQPGPIRAPQPVTVMHPAVMSGASGGSSQPINITVNLTATLDGQTIANVVQTKTLQRNRRNVSNGLTLPNGH